MGAPPFKGVRLRRFILDPECFEESAVNLTGAVAKHVRNVLRLKTGDKVLVTDGHTRKFVCCISSINKSSVQAEIVEKLETAEDPLPFVTLAQAIPKGRKMDTIVRMACEIGAERIVPVVAERCVIKLNKDSQAKKMERWREISVSAAQQSGSDCPALIVNPVGIEDLPDLVPSDHSIALWENETRSLKSALSGLDSKRSLLLLAGPEGGFTDNEVEKLKSSGFVTASLGSQILRTETAGIAALSALFYHFSN
ncbi:MAG TPA: 16S rRNA (uracil(1498)-N(3))-methyltransferase [Nitrospirae bacterium]|nr:16S rRNA (uracil(1498)-N(3))-methyltransferase [Nitrospirota bacterium]